MQYTSAEAGKLLRKLNEEYQTLITKENKSSVFTAAVGENIDDVRPAYDFAETRTKIRDLQAKIRKVKHAINGFNLETTIPGYDMTIDQMLVHIPQLSEEKRLLTEMAGRLPKARTQAYGNRTIIEYDYANYDVEEASRALEGVTDELSKAQTALDVVNNSKSFEIDI